MEKLFISDYINNKFDYKVDSYEFNATIQKIIAERLFHLIKERENNYKRIFEIGYGTGFLTGYLVSLNPDLLILNDISKNMIEKVKKNISFDNAIYLNDDFLNIDDKFDNNDLICSNAVFQWIKDLKYLFKKVNKLLCNNGIFAFSTFIDGTFKELDIAFKNAYLRKGISPVRHTLDFKTKDCIDNLLISSNFNIISSFNKEYRLHYNTPLDFLKSVHNIGATIGSNRVEYSIMRKMLEEYKNNFFTDSKVYATYNVLYIIAYKK